MKTNNYTTDSALIQVYAVYHDRDLTMQVELEQDLEKYSIKDDPSVALEYAISKIEAVSAFNTHFTECDKQENCTRDTREVVVRLKMIEWGIYGMGEATAGTYLAYFYSKLGPYFGNDDPEKTNKWPHIPLSQKPTELEENLNELFVKITEAKS